MMLVKLLSSILFVCLMMSTTKASPDDVSILTFANGAQESHEGVVTSMTATVQLDFKDGFSKLDFDLKVSNGYNITQSHLHCAQAGVNGPVVVFLFGPVSPGIDVRNGRLSRGTLRGTDILSNTTDFLNTAVCGIAINNIASLYSAILARAIYLNVHTTAYPAGEVRGQVFA